MEKNVILYSDTQNKVTKLSSDALQFQEPNKETLAYISDLRMAAYKSR